MLGLWPIGHPTLGHRAPRGKVGVLEEGGRLRQEWAELTRTLDAPRPASSWEEQTHVFFPAGTSAGLQPEELDEFS